MSLGTLLGSPAAHDLLAAWPDHPYTLDDSPVCRLVSAQTILGFLDTGCTPSAYVNAFYQGEGLHPARYSSDDRVLPAAARTLIEKGCTFQLREVNRWYPPLGAICASIQAETGCSAYATAFITPAGQQGLDYHWDQYLGIVVQLAGSKTWELWQPKVEAPYRDHSMSTDLWQDEWIKEWKQTGPDHEFELTAGRVLVLPRGWVHNPHSRNATDTSVHLTFVVKERTPLWVAERLVGSALNDARFRSVVQPSSLDIARLPETISGVRDLMIDYLGGLDPETLAPAVRYAAEQETSHDTL